MGYGISVNYKDYMAWRKTVSLEEVDTGTGFQLMGTSMDFAMLSQVDNKKHTDKYNFITLFKGNDCIKAGMLDAHAFASLGLIQRTVLLQECVDSEYTASLRYKKDSKTTGFVNNSGAIIFSELFGEVRNKVGDDVLKQQEEISMGCYYKITASKLNEKTKGHIVYNCYSNKFEYSSVLDYRFKCRQTWYRNPYSIVNRYGDIITLDEACEGSLSNLGYGASIPENSIKTTVNMYNDGLNKGVGGNISVPLSILSTLLYEVFIDVTLEEFNKDFCTSWKKADGALNGSGLRLRIDNDAYDIDFKVKDRKMDIAIHRLIFKGSRGDYEVEFIDKYDGVRVCCQSVYSALVVATSWAYKINKNIHKLGDFNKMTILCVHTDGISASKVSEMSKVFKNLRLKELGRFTSGDGDELYAHMTAAAMKRADSGVIMDTPELQSGAHWRKKAAKYATGIPFGAKKYVVFTEEAGLDALINKYGSSQVVPVKLAKGGSDKFEYVKTDIEDVSLAVADILKTIE